MAKLHRLELLNQISPWDIGRVCVELEKFFRSEMCYASTTVWDDAQIFPMVMNRIFGNESCIGLYITNVVQEPMNSGFSICFNFFSTNGTLFWYFNRLFESSVPFRLPINQLPQQLQSILTSNTPPAFYKNIVVGMDITCFSLNLNAFQYFLFQFALYGLTSHKNIYPPTGRVTIDRKTTTLYLALAAEYLCTFLPRAPPPAPLKGNMKSMMTSMVLCPTATRKYLNNENSPRASPTLINPGMDSTTSLDAWRAECITSIFLDVWLATFTPSTDGMELPSIELLRSIRVLVKQIHAFSGTGSYIDSCPMEEFRRTAALQLQDRIEPFFMSLFDIWPLDGSLIDLIELWLSYIQPWRYLHDRDFNRLLPPAIDYDTVNQFSRFIVANLISYTQPIVKLLPRLAQLEFIPFKSPISPKILPRLLKVVSNRTMLDFIRHNEMILYRLCHQRHISSPMMSTTLPEENYPIELDELEIAFWMGGSVTNDRKRYTPLFSEPVKYHLCQLMEKLCCGIAYTKDRIKMFKRKQKENITVLQYLWQTLRGAKSAISYETALDDCDVLESICQWLTENFGIPPFEVEPFQIPPADDEIEPFEIPAVNNVIFQESPNHVNRTQHICAQTYLGDPQLLPITSKEIKFLVRALYRVSKKVNVMYSGELSSLWHSDRWWGSLARLMLQPPDSYMERVHLANGFSTMVERSVVPQLSLRFFASYTVVRNVIGAFVVGALVFGSPIYGFLILILLALVLTLLRTIIRF